jgi:predicted DNA binding CopG/RHH family protein
MRTEASHVKARRLELMKHVPKLKTDAEAEAFLQKDLSRLDFSRFKSARFEFQANDAQINMRLRGAG